MIKVHAGPPRNRVSIFCMGKDFPLLHSACCSVGIWPLSWGLKHPGRETDH